MSDPDAWDDSALIKTFQQATESHRLSSQTEPTPAGPNGPSGRKSQPKKSTVDRQTGMNLLDNNRTIPASSKEKVRIRTNRDVRNPNSTTRKRCDNNSGVADFARPKYESFEKDSGFKKPMRIPPPPPALYGADLNPELESLLVAWYEAGYRAGHYVASNQGTQ